MVTASLMCTRRRSAAAMPAHNAPATAPNERHQQQHAPPVGIVLPNQMTTAAAPMPPSTSWPFAADVHQARPGGNGDGQRGEDQRRRLHQDLLERVVAR